MQPIEGLHIEITSRCNLRCEYCYQRTKKHHESLKVEDICKIKELCENYNKELGVTKPIDKVSISGGETLLENNFEIIDEIVEVFPEAEIALFTNGINVIKYWDRLPIDRIGNVSMSLDGKDEVISKLSDAKLKVYEDIICGIEKILEAKIELRLSVSITRDTVAHMDELFEDLEKRNILSNEKLEILVYPIWDYATETGLGNSTYENEDEFFELAKKVSVMIKKYNNVFMSVNADFGRLLQVIGGSQKFKFNRCVSGTMGMTVGPDGKVYFCSDFAGDSAIVADIRKELKFDKEKLRYILRGSVTRNAKCKGCMYRHVCLGGCRLRALARNAESNGDGFYCGTYTNDKFIENIGLFIK